MTWGRKQTLWPAGFQENLKARLLLWLVIMKLCW